MKNLSNKINKIKNMKYTRQQIGAWLSKPEIIKGGEGTPYLPLSDFPESLED